MAAPPPPQLTPWVPGQSGNPGGRPKGARTKLQGKFMNGLADDFELHGQAAIVRCREEDPVNYLKICASLMPKQVEESKPMEDVTDAELRAGVEYLRSYLASHSGAGTAPPPQSKPTH